MMPDFLFRAVLGGLAVAAVAGPLGCFVVWRRMAYFGDTLAHGALLGVALGFLLHVSPAVSVVAVGVGLALALVALSRRKTPSADTALGIAAHAMLAFGLIAVSFLDRVRMDLMGLLFGDILALSPSDVAVAWGGAVLVLVTLAFLWRRLLALTVSGDLARVEGYSASRLHLAHVLLMAIVVALAMQMVGILLITALLIIPAAAARPFAASPQRMAMLASLMGAMAVCLGLAGSWYADLPAGPSIVAAATVLFAMGTVKRVSA